MTAYRYSIILPIFNEEGCLVEMINRLENVLNILGGTFEIICVDDCSIDSSWSIIQNLHGQKPFVKGIRFKRNFGHQLAVYAGIKKCNGDYIAVLDSDGQDPPEILPQLFAKCQEGFDVVYAVRKKRKEHVFKRAAYNLFYRLYRKTVPFDVPLDSGDFSVFSKSVADFIKSLNEKRPFIRGLRSWHGGKQFGFEYERQKRLSGYTKYPFGKLFLLAINGLTSFSRIPLRFISISGIFISLGAFICGIALIIFKFFVGINLLGWTSTSILIIFFGGINLFVLGIIGEYIGDIFDEVKNRPPFLVDQTLGF